MEHKPVLLSESVEGLNLKEGMTVVDATLGGGGHSKLILEKIGESGILVAIDQDEEAIGSFEKYLSETEVGRGRVVLVRDNFSNLEKALGERGINSVHAVLADLGYSSLQLEDGKRGLSFLQDGPLDMRLNQGGETTAEEIINEYPAEKLEKIIKEFGEERFAKNIARLVDGARKIKRIATTGELVGIIRQAVPERFQHGALHPATKTFQALRIEVNKELENLERFIPQAVAALSPGGRLGIISFHSLEDRIVKNMFRENARGCICPKDFPECRCENLARVRVLTRKPIVPSALEVGKNPRARSAKLRICEKLELPQH